jgi:ABC-2 type transport system permease protein
MKAFAALVWIELRLFIREPLTLVFVLVLPVVVLYVLNGVFNTQRMDATVWDGLSAVNFYTSAYVALVAATAGVLSLPVHLASYREHGVLRRFQASAVRPVVLIGAHLAVTAIIATVGAVILAAISVVAYDAALPHHWLGVLGAFALVLGAFVSFGGVLGLLLPTARSAQAVGVLLFFVFMMLGGAGPPREVLPAALGRIADVVPVTHGGRLLRGPWMGRDWDLVSTAVMAGLLLVSLAAILALAHEEARRH